MQVNCSPHSPGSIPYAICVGTAKLKTLREALDATHQKTLLKAVDDVKKPLEAQLEFLGQTYNHLKNNHSSLQANHSALTTNHTALQKSLAASQDICSNILKTLNITSDACQSNSAAILTAVTSALKTLTDNAENKGLQQAFATAEQIFSNENNN